MASESERKPAFKDGDVVYLKSGGPPMTVDLCRDDGVIPVRWFVGGELRDYNFPAECLTACRPKGCFVSSADADPLLHATHCHTGAPQRASFERRLSGSEIPLTGPEREAFLDGMEAIGGHFGSAPDHR